MSSEQLFRSSRATALLVWLTTVSTGNLLMASETVYLMPSADGVPRFSNYPIGDNPTIFLRDPVIPKTMARMDVSKAHQQKRELLIPLIRQTAESHAMDPALLAALVDVESSFNPAAVSPKGAMGLMQLIPKTASQYGLAEPYDPARNLDAGTRYLKDLLALHDGNIALAIAAYNAGQGSVSRYKRRIPPYDETLLYVPHVLSKLKEYRAIFVERYQ